MDWSECINTVELIIGGLFAPVVVAAILAALQAASPEQQERRAPAGPDVDDGEPHQGGFDFLKATMSPRFWWLRMTVCLAVAVIAWVVHLAVGSGSVDTLALGTATGAVSLFLAALLQGAPTG